MSQHTPPEDETDRPRRDGPSTPPDTAARRVEPPRYGMLLPEGESIEDYIVPVTTRRASAGRSSVQEGDGRQPTFPDNHPSSPRYRGPVRAGRPSTGTDPVPRGNPFVGAPSGPGSGRVRAESPQEAARRTKRSRANRAGVLGLLLLVFGPLTGFTASLVQTLDSSMDEMTATRSVRNGEEVRLGADTDAAISTPTARRLEECTVTAPDGTDLEVTTVDDAVTREGTRAVPGTRFRTTEAGDYRISCEDADADARLRVGPPMVIRPAGTGWIGAGSFVGAMGLGMALWALFVRRRLRD